MKAVLEAVHGSDLALTALVGSARDQDLVLALFSMPRATRGAGVHTSFRTGMLRTLCFSRSSLLSGACQRQNQCPMLLCAFLEPTNRHDNAADAAGSAEVSLARLAARARNGVLDLGHRAGGGCRRWCCDDGFRRLAEMCAVKNRTSQWIRLPEVR